MKGVNIFGTGIQTSASSNVQQGPRGIGFRYLDDERNFDIGDKRLANVSDPVEVGDAVNKNYSDFQGTKLREIMDSEHKIISDSFSATLEENKSLHRSMIDSLNEGINFQARTIDNINSKLENLEGKTITQDILSQHNEINEAKRQSLKAELSSNFTKGFDELTKELSDQSDVIQRNTSDISVNFAEIESLKSMVQTKLDNAEKIMQSLQNGIAMNRDHIEIVDNHLKEKINRLEIRMNQFVPLDNFNLI